MTSSFAILVSGSASSSFNVVDNSPASAQLQSKFESVEEEEANVDIHLASSSALSSFQRNSQSHTVSSIPADVAEDEWQDDAAILDDELAAFVSSPTFLPTSSSSTSSSSSFSYAMSSQPIPSKSQSSLPDHDDEDDDVKEEASPPKVVGLQLASTLDSMLFRFQQDPKYLAMVAQFEAQNPSDQDDGSDHDDEQKQ